MHSKHVFAARIQATSSAVLILLLGTPFPVSHSIIIIPPLPFSCDKGIVALGFPRVSKQTRRIIRLKSALPKKSAPEALNPTLSQQTNTILVPTRYYLEDDDAHAKLSSSPVADDNKRGRA